MPDLIRYISFYLVVLQEVSGLEGEEQGHVIVQWVFAVNIISFVLQQPACLVHHPVRRVNSNHHLSQFIFDVHSYVQLGSLHLWAFVVFVRISYGLEYYEGDFFLVTEETV